MGENFVVRVHNDSIYITPPEGFAVVYTQAVTEISTYQPPDVPKVERSGVDTVLIIGTGTFLVSALAIGILLNNSQILRRLDNKIPADNRGSLDDQDSLQ